MSTANTPKLDLLRIQDTWQFGDEAFNRFIDDADNKLVGIAHLDDKAHWSTWKKDTAYVKNDVVRIQNNKSHQYYQCITAGTSGTTEPTNNVTGSVVTDGTVTWMVMSLSEATSNGGVIQIWLSGNYYNRGDAVIYGTALYRCKVDHTSSDWDTDYEYWQEVFASIRLWKPIIYYFENDTVVVDNSIYKCIVAHKSGTVFDSTEEANWEMIGGVGGAEEWASNTKYAENQLVTKDGILYQCNTAHTSGTDFDLDIANWNIVYASIVPWELNVYYPAGGVVTYEDCIYRCIAGNEATIDFDEVKDNYELIFANLQVWKPDVTYLVGSIVLYDGVLYRCNTTHTSTTPFDVTMWDLVYANIRQYADNTIYKVGSEVIYNRNLYRCIQSHTSSDGFDMVKINSVSGDLFTAYKRDIPVEYVLDLGNPYDVAKIVLDQFGSFAAISLMDVYGSIDNTTFKKIGIYSNPSASSTSGIISVETIPMSAQYLKFVVRGENTFYDPLSRAPFVTLQNLGVYGNGNYWELIGYSPDGLLDWQTYKKYNQNDVILYDDVIYRANETHISSSLFSLDTAKWDLVYANIREYADNTFYKFGSNVTYNGKLYRCKKEHTSSTYGFNQDAVKVFPGTLAIITTSPHTLDIDLEDTYLVEGVIVSQDTTMSYASHIDYYGSTDNVTYYKIGEINNNAPGVDIYVNVHCNIRYLRMVVYSHIVTSEDLYNLRIIGDIDSWDCLDTTETWNENTYYPLHALVVHEGSLYRCIEKHTSSTTFDNTKWENLSGGATIENWATNTNYEVGNLVIYGDNLYQCNTAHTSSTFDNDRSNWTLIGGSGGGGGSGTGYSQIDLINITATQADPYVIDIAISSNPTHVLPPTDVLKQMTGKYTSENVMKFNPEDKDKFDYNDKGIKFEGGYMMINQSIPTDLEPAVPLGDNYTRISVPIDLSIYKSVESVVCL